MEHDFIIITDTDEVFNYPPLQILYSDAAYGRIRTTRYLMSEEDFLDILKWANE